VVYRRLSFDGARNKTVSRNLTAKERTSRREHRGVYRCTPRHGKRTEASSALAVSAAPSSVDIDIPRFALLRIGSIIILVAVPGPG
jgi:hypothetical protein